MTGPALAMNPEIRARWTAALRSGEYRQGHEALRSRDPDGGADLFCCLGVLCDLAVKDGVEVSARQMMNIDSRRLWYYDGRGDYLPESVMEWAGLDDSSPEVMADASKHPLAWVNDDKKWSFAQIADAIDGGAS